MNKSRERNKKGTHAHTHTHKIPAHLPSCLPQPHPSPRLGRSVRRLLGFSAFRLFFSGPPGAPDGDASPSTSLRGSLRPRRWGGIGGGDALLSLFRLFWRMEKREDLLGKKKKVRKRGKNEEKLIKQLGEEGARERNGVLRRHRALHFILLCCVLFCFPIFSLFLTGRPQHFASFPSFWDRSRAGSGHS